MSDNCRLCDASTTIKFEKTVLGRHRVAFSECSGCGSMQTEEPYWLDESYRDGRRQLDTNAASRALLWQRLLFSIHRALQLPPTAKLLDWGAGDGLLVRLLRDVGIDAYYHDPLAVNQYANGFEGDPTASGYDMMTAYEVWEHLPNPAEELSLALGLEPRVYVATTDIYAGQDDSWPYLNLLTGRHVFFYSSKAVALVAKQHGYEHHIARNKRILLYRPGFPPSAISRVKKILSDRYSRLRAAYFGLLRKRSLAPQDKLEIAKKIQLEMESSR